jgi:hypothetical protein
MLSQHKEQANELNEPNHDGTDWHDYKREDYRHDCWFCVSIKAQCKANHRYP